MQRTALCLALFASLAAAGLAAAQGPSLQLVPRPPQHDAPPQLGFYGHFLNTGGIYVQRVFYGSEAQRIGLERGDLILAVNHRTIRSPRDYYEGLSHTSTGRVTLLVQDVRTGHLSRVVAFVPYDPGGVFIYGQERPRNVLEQPRAEYERFDKLPR